MKPIAMALIAGTILFGSYVQPLHAGQRYYLATSPDGKTRVTVSQRLLRRVGDRLFFEYPVSLMNVKTGKSVELFTAGAPLVKENERGTFRYNMDSLKTEWASDGAHVLVFWEREEGIWTVAWVDTATGKAKNLDEEIRNGLLNLIGRRGAECQTPVVSISKWLSPLKPVFKVDTVCGKPGEEGKKDLHKMLPLEHWVMYDAEKDVIKDCPDCAEAKAMKIFTKKPKPTPTATPATEETPTAQ